MLVPAWWDQRLTSREIIQVSKYVDMIGWDDCPHITMLPQQERDDMAADLQPHQREARQKGIPSLGAGAVYPVPEDSLYCDSFEIPDFWPRAYALDVGWNKTACLWGALDPEPEKPVFYLYDEYYHGENQPLFHAESIKARGEWITGAIDYAGGNQFDGTKTREEYLKHGLNVINANKKGKEAGLFHVLSLMQTSRVKVFRGRLPNFISELRLYRRNEKGKIVKENDHLMDCLRYLLYTPGIFKTKPVSREYGSRGTGEW